MDDDDLQASEGSDDKLMGGLDEPDTSEATYESFKTKPKITPVLLICVLAASIGSSAQFGFNLSVINNLENAIRSSLNGSVNSSLVVSDSFSTPQWSATVAVFAIGGMIGALSAGFLANLIGRKWAMLGNNLSAVIGVGLESFAVSPYMLIAGRLVIGFNSGMNTVLAPLYITEISPVRYRGAMGTFHQLTITLTILLAQVLGINVILGRPDNQFYAWRILMAFPLLFVIFQVIVLPFCPESPKYLFIYKKKGEAAAKAIEILSGKDSVQQELDNLRVEMEGLTTSQTNLFTTFKHFITSPSMRLALIVSICLHLSQQLSGFGAILSYSTEMFSHAGINNGDIATAVLGVVLVLGTVATIVLIEYVGRRPLMLYGLGGMSVFFLLVSSAFCFQFAFYEHYTGVTAPSVLLIIFTFGTTVAFSVGPGAIPWLMVAEMFQQDARSFAVSIATIVNWLSNFVVTFLFPFMLTELKPYPFIIFAALCGLFWLFMYFFLPETKGRTIDEIIQHFKDVTSSNKKPPLHVQEKKE